MRIERSAGAVVFRRKSEKIEYLLLRHPSASKVKPHDIWDFPKGLLEKGEDALETAKREITEETELTDFEVVPGFKETDSFFFRWEGELIRKFVAYFLVEAKEGKIKLSHEHTDFAWLPFKQAHERLTGKGAKEIFKKANQFLQKGKIQLKMV